MPTSGASARLVLLMATNCPRHGKHSPFESHLVEELAAKEEQNSVSVIASRKGRQGEKVQHNCPVILVIHD